MQSESAIENRASAAPVRSRRRKRGNGSAEGPVFVDNSGRRSRLLRRFGILLGVVCLGYAVVLGMAFMGWGASLTPSSLLPFGRGGQAGSAPGGNGPQGGLGNEPTKPTGTPPSGVPTGEPPSSAPSAAASAASN